MKITLYIAGFSTLILLTACSAINAVSKEEAPATSVSEQKEAKDKTINAYIEGLSDKSIYESDNELH